MRGRDRLHSVERTSHAPADELTKLTEGAFGSFVSSESQEPEISHAPPARGPDEPRRGGRCHLSCGLTPLRLMKKGERDGRV